jgi:hypothetical protein
MFGAAVGLHGQQFLSVVAGHAPGKWTRCRNSFPGLKCGTLFNRLHGKTSIQRREL